MVEQTRVHYQQELEQLEGSALGGLDLVSAALSRTLEAIEHQDVELAQIVVADDDRIDGRYLEVHQALITLLATQSPVATDLRLISALLHVLKNVERMGDQCVNVCKKETRCETYQVTVCKSVPRCHTETYTACVEKRIPYEATREVCRCVPHQEQVTCCRMVKRCVQKQVPVEECPAPCPPPCAPKCGH